MNSVLLIQWSPVGADERLAALCRSGFRVKAVTPNSSQSLQPALRNPPDAFVIDLQRNPSTGQAVAIALRQRKTTRHVPIVFVGGEPDKVRRVRELMPDAAFTRWQDDVTGAINRALTRVSAQPVIPGTMAPYAGVPLPKKLGIREGSTVALVSAPRNFEKTLGPLPRNATVGKRVKSPAAVVVLFVKSTAELKRRLPVTTRAMAEGGRLWIAWPKKSSGVAANLSPNNVRAIGLDAGLVDFKICAIDETWSGLCFARRRERRERRG
jgi:CheY-like chemotaxis protein